MHAIPGTIWMGAVAAFAAAAFAGGASPDAAACRAETPAPGYRTLFDGTQASLSGWAQAGPGRFELGADCTLGSVGGLGLYWNRQALSSPLTLRVEWMIPGDDNSGVFVGFPAPGNDPFVAVNRGYEVQIDATDAPNATTGAIYSFQAADQAVRDRVLNPPGRWNTFEITVDAPLVVVRLNGAVVNRFVSRDPARSTLGRGLVGLQNHSDADRVFFRSVQAKEWGASRPRRCPRARARAPGDEFRGRLDGCRWNRIVRYDGGGLDVSGGALHLELAGDDPPGNLVLQRAPARDWTIGTTVRAPAGEAGLVVYRTDRDWVRLVAGGGRARLESERCGAAGPSASVAAPRGSYRLRLRRSGAGYTGFVGARRVGAIAAPRLSADAAFGLLATDTSHASPPAYAAFDRFTAALGRRVAAARAACP